jgi:hypothetical protein
MGIQVGAGSVVRKSATSLVHSSGLEAARIRGRDHLTAALT